MGAIFCVFSVAVLPACDLLHLLLTAKRVSCPRWAPLPTWTAVAPLDGRAPEEIGRLALPARAVLVRLGVALAVTRLLGALRTARAPDAALPAEIGRLALPARAVLVRLGVALARDELTCRLVLPDGA